MLKAKAFQRTLILNVLCQYFLFSVTVKQLLAAVIHRAANAQSQSVSNALLGAIEVNRCNGSQDEHHGNNAIGPSSG